MPRISYGTKYTAQISGSIWKPVACENCGCVYYYQIKDQASGSSTDFLWLNKQGAMDSAKGRANQNLENRFKNAVRNYPCPDCGFYQTEMIKRMRNNIWQRGIVFGILAFALVFSFTTSAINSLTALGYSFIAGAIVCLTTLSKLYNYNPNSNAQSRTNQKFSESYPVIKQSDMELLRRSQF